MILFSLFFQYKSCAIKSGSKVPFVNKIFTGVQFMKVNDLPAIRHPKKKSAATEKKETNAILLATKILERKTL